MSNRINILNKEQILGLIQLGWSDRKINRAMGIHRVTIARYRKEFKDNLVSDVDKKGIFEPRYTEGQAQEDKRQSVPFAEKQVPTDRVVHFQVPTDPSDLIKTSLSSKSRASVYHVIIQEKLRLGQSARSIYQDLVQEKVYAGSYDSVKRYIRKLRKRLPRLYARIETAPGEEAQVDFGEGAPTLKNGRYPKPWLFVMTLSYSRKSYEEVVWHQDVETFIRCHEHAFAHLGGVPQIIRIDNLKSGVIKAHLYEPELNPHYFAFSQHYQFVILPCKVATPQHKGKVESNVKYVQNNALKGKKFDSLEDQNQYLRHWNKTWASTRIHGTVKKQVNAMYQAEIPCLKPLPEASFPFFRIAQRKVNIVDSHIEIAGAYYPVPPQFMGQKVIVHYNQKWVKIFDNQQLIQQLTAIPKGCFHPDKSCLPINKTLSQAVFLRRLYDQCRRIGPAVIQWAQQAMIERSQSAYRAICGVVSLIKKYSPDIVNQACRQSLEKSVFNYHIVKETAEALLVQKRTQPQIPFIQESDIIRLPHEYQQLLSPARRSGGEKTAWTN